MLSKMKKNAMIIVIATLMVLSSFTVAIETQTSSISGSTAESSILPGVTYSGNVYIYANGTVSNTTVVSGTMNNYSLNMNISGTMYIYRNGTTLNGNNLFINGTQGSLHVIDASHVTVENIYLYSSGDSLQVLDSYNFTAKYCTIQSTSTNSVGAPVHIKSSDYIYLNNDWIFGSTIVDNYGIYLQNTPEINVTYTWVYAGFGFYVESSTSLFYLHEDYINASNTGVFFEGYFNENIIITNSTFTSPASENFYGIDGSYTNIVSNVSIQGNTFTNSYDNSIYLWAAEEINISIEHNTFLNSHDAVLLGDTFNVLFAHNDLYNITGWAFDLSYGYNTTISWNNVTGLSGNVYTVFELEYCVAGLVITHNSILLNTTNSYPTHGVYIYGSSKALISYNAIVNVSKAVTLDHMSGRVAVTHNNISIPDNMYYNSTGIFVNSTASANVSFNILSDEEYAIFLNYTSNLDIYGNNLSMAGYGVFINGYTVNNVNVIGNYISIYGNYGDGVNSTVQMGVDWNIDNNVILSSWFGIALSWDLVNVTINGNYIYDSIGNAISTAWVNNLTISGNTVEYNSSFDPYSWNSAIYVLYAILGVTVTQNMVSGNNNTYQNNTYAIYIVGSSPVLISGNTVTNVSYAIEVGGSQYLSVFENVIKDVGYGLGTGDNSNGNLFDNHVFNSVIGVYSYYDNGLNYYGNTISNASHDLVFLYWSSNLVFYHNNFINGTNDSVGLIGNTNLQWNLSSPIGGNYWSAYTHYGVNGFGILQYNVSGSSVDYLPLAFPWYAYTITFVESGLPAGTGWAVTLGSEYISSVMSTVTFSPQAAGLVNMAYSISSVPGYVASVYSGTIGVDRTNVVINITFVPYTYNVTFTESNLPAGSTWSVTLNGATHTSATGTITFSMANGTYDYTIGTVSGYHAETSSGTVAVNAAAPVPVAVAFAQNVYTVTLTETGLPAGLSWNASIGGITHTTNSTQLVFTMVSGTYSINVSGPSKYTVSMPSNVTVNNANATITVAFSSTGSSTTSSGSGSIYLGIGIGVAVGAIAAALGTMFYTGTGVFSNVKKGKGGNP